MEEKAKRYLEKIPVATSEVIENSEPYKFEEGVRELHLFAKENTMSQKNGKIYGQWHNTFGKACRGAPTTYIEDGAVLDINDIGKCSGTGETVMDYTLI
jgi:effector-binding domain-containing protein